MKAKAAVLFEVGKRLELCDVEVQPPQAGEVLIRMAAGGVCHSDLHVMTGHLTASLPAILGHEGAGVVAEVGPGVSGLRAGDHVIPLWRLSCGVCELCTDGRPALCAAGTQIRMTGRLLDGTTRFALAGQEIKHFAGVSSFAEYTVVPEKAVLKVPDDLPLDRAALLGCAVITGVGAVFNAARVRPGSSVVVFGTGGVGLNVVQGAALAGAERIIAVDVLDRKLELARRFGATHGVDASQGSQAQTLANAYLAIEADLEIVPAVNKIDLPQSRPDDVAAEVAELVGDSPERVLRLSAKTGAGVAEALDAIVEADEALMEKYLGEGAVSADELSAAVPKALAAGTLVPILCTSAKKDIGIAELPIGPAATDVRIFRFRCVCVLPAGHRLAPDDAAFLVGEDDELERVSRGDIRLVQQLSDLRKQLRTVRAEYKVVKNRLARLAGAGTIVVDNHDEIALVESEAAARGAAPTRSGRRIAVPRM